MIFFRATEKTKSNNPKKAATAREMTITTSDILKACDLVGQLIRWNSRLNSFK